jgi:hypothetical protein
VATLTATGTAAVHDAAHELSRVERDLHDGAQARLERRVSTFDGKATRAFGAKWWQPKMTRGSDNASRTQPGTSPIVHASLVDSTRTY